MGYRVRRDNSSLYKWKNALSSFEKICHYDNITIITLRIEGVKHVWTIGPLFIFTK